MHTAPAKASPWQVFFLVAIGVFMSTLDSSIVNIALPTILKEFGSSLAITEWVVMVYLLTITCFLLTFGRLGDILGRKRIYAAGLFVFTLSSLFCALAPHIGMLIAARLLQGLGSAMIMACTPALLVDAFPDSQRGRILGLNGAVVACGLTAGPAIGGFLLSVASWRLIFYVNIPIGLVATLLVLRYLKESTRQKGIRNFDWQGTLLAALSMGLLLMALTHGYDWGFTSFLFLGILGLSLVCALLFILTEKKKPEPMLDLSLFQNRLFALPALCGMLLFCSLFFMVFLMPFYLMLPAGFSSSLAGKMLMIPFAFLLIFSPLSGSLSDRMGSRFLCTLGLFIMACGLFFLSCLTATETIWDIAWRLAMVGIGTAIFVSPNSATVMGGVPATHRGSGGAVLASARNLGMVLGVALAGAIFHFVFDRNSAGASLSAFSPEHAEVFMQAFRTAMATGACLALFSMIPSWMRGKETRKP
ncbi:MFS transporter [Desulfobotulus sp.]|jgi:EmrB/QacA subfamily drug resistance transporter|uniref:MFS transporter n=1 Tax=Desulfobotulus sp. TaxID=1940337 RepID=UPI002A369665|nr:MFS transporter [Desulfobotulus sp.]MDY0162641.1 MFS transporter [Desulfobotulus sp.]